MKEAVSAPDFRDVITEPAAFSQLVERRLALKAIIADAEAEIKETVDPAITALLTDSDTVSVLYGEHPVTIVETRRRNLSKERLIEAGVPAATIAQCTTETVSTYLSVR